MNFSHVTIVKCSSIGDILQALIVAKKIKKEQPRSRVTWITDEKYASLIKTFSFVDEVIGFPLEGLKKGWISFIKTFVLIKNRCKKIHSDVVIDLQGNTKSALITFFLSSEKKVGFCKSTVSEWPNLLVTNQKLQIDPSLNIQDQYLKFASFLVNKELSIDSEKKIKPNTYLVMVCPGSFWKNKCPDPKSFENFLLKIKKRYGFKFVFVGVDSRDYPSFHDEPFHLKLEWESWKLLLDQVDIVISADSCALHLASICGTPTFSLFGPSSLTVYKPLGDQHQGVQGSCPYNQRFIKRCSRLRTCSSGKCIKALSENTLFEAFVSHYESLSNNKSKST